MPLGNNPDEYDNVLAPAAGAGMAVMGSNPYGAAMMAAASIAGKVLSPAPAGPSRADSGLSQTISSDFSGWTVATGGGKAAGGSRGLDLPPWMILGALGLVVFGWVRLRKS